MMPHPLFLFNGYIVHLRDNIKRLCQNEVLPPLLFRQLYASLNRFRCIYEDMGAIVASDPESWDNLFRLTISLMQLCCNFKLELMDWEDRYPQFSNSFAKFSTIRERLREVAEIILDSIPNQPKGN